MYKTCVKSLNNVPNNFTWVLFEIWWIWSEFLTCWCTHDILIQLLNSWYSNHTLLFPPFQITVSLAFGGFPVSILNRILGKGRCYKEDNLFCYVHWFYTKNIFKYQINNCIAQLIFWNLHCDLIKSEQMTLLQGRA